MKVFRKGCWRWRKREYGLEKPELEIDFDVSQKPFRLFIGAATPVGKRFYARWEGERGYFLLPSEMKAVFRQSVYGLREKRVFRSPMETARKITVKMGAYSGQWMRDGHEWHWFEPVAHFGQKMPLDSMQKMLNFLQNFYIKEFMDNNRKTSAELGFFMIQDMIRIESEDGRKETFFFGHEVPDRNAYYGLREGEKTVFFVERGKAIELLDLMKKIMPQGAEAQAPEVQKAAPPLTGRFFS